MKVSVNKLENVVGDMELIETKMTGFCTFNGKWRSTKERIYRIEIKMEMSDGTSYVSSVNTSKFTYKPAGPATGRFPIDDISELDRALCKLNITRDFDIEEVGYYTDTYSLYVEYEDDPTPHLIAQESFPYEPFGDNEVLSLVALDEDDLGGER